jgi:hypothetical protein
VVLLLRQARASTSPTAAAIPALHPRVLWLWGQTPLVVALEVLLATVVVLFMAGALVLLALALVLVVAVVLAVAAAARY